MRLQFLNADDRIFDQLAGLPVNFGARAYDPTAGSNSDGEPAGYSGLTDATRGDWSWKPERYDARGRYRLAIIGPRCTCALHRPVGTDCARHR